jgi:hypothetical protein
MVFERREHITTNTVECPKCKRDVVVTLFRRIGDTMTSDHEATMVPLPYKQEKKKDDECGR